MSARQTSGGEIGGVSGRVWAWTSGVCVSTNEDVKIAREVLIKGNMVGGS